MATGTATDWLEEKIMGHLYGGVSYTAPGTYYLGLASEASDAEAGTVTELSGDGYARQAMALTHSGSNVSNTDEEVFPEATGDWGDVTHLLVTDAASGGNIHHVIPLDATQTVNSGGTLTVAAGQAAWSCN